MTNTTTPKAIIRAYLHALASLNATDPEVVRLRTMAGRAVQGEAAYVVARQMAATMGQPSPDVWGAGS